MSWVKRVDFFAYIDDEVAELDYHESDDGSWVPASDYDTLAAELATVKKVAYGNLELMEERDTLRTGRQRLEKLLGRVQASLSLDDTEWGFSTTEKRELLADIKTALRGNGSDNE